MDNPEPVDSGQCLVLYKKKLATAPFRNRRTKRSDASLLGHAVRSSTNGALTSRVKAYSWLQQWRPDLNGNKYKEFSREKETKRKYSYLTFTPHFSRLD